MSLLKWYRDWHLRRTIRRYADWFFRESPIHRYLREKHGSETNSEVRGEMAIPKQYGERKK